MREVKAMLRYFPTPSTYHLHPTSCDTQFLQEFIFADWRFFVFLRELIFAIRTDWFFLLGITALLKNTRTLKFKSRIHNNLRSGPISAVLIHFLLRAPAKIGLIQTLSRLCSLRPDFGRNADWLLEQCHRI